MFLKQHITLFQRFSSLQQIFSPTERMGLDIILQNINKNNASAKIYNNSVIGINCTKIALKYSKCYLCKFPIVNQSIRYMKNMQFIDKNIQMMSSSIYSEFPKEMKFVRTLGKYFKYQNRNLYSSFSLIFTEKFTQEQQKIALKFLTAIESVTLGFEMHYNLGTNYRPNTLVQIGLKVVQKVIKDKYLVLAGDYFHIRASVLGGQTRNIQLSRLLSEMEINLCKFVYLKEQLNKKIQKRGYNNVTIEQIFRISQVHVKQITQGLIGMDIIKGENPQSKQQIYQCIGLMVLYRKQLQNFMFNFYKILGKYLEYTKNIKMNFCEDYTLTNYLFYQSAQKNQRIDLAYLNTVQMMNDQISFLQKQLLSLIGQEKYKQIHQKMNYIMMIHS